LGRIRSSAHVLDRQFTRLIEFFKLEDGRLEADLEPTDPCAVVRGACDRWREAAQVKGLRLRQYIEDGVERLQVRGDERRLAAAMDEYLDNAIKVTTQGCVEVQAIRRDERIEFRVEDAGPGLSQHDYEDLFTAFTDKGDLRPRSLMGIGIGLHMVRRLGALMEAESFVAESSPRGSTFTLSLSLV
jgi:signal transduction histidine kinase